MIQFKANQFKNTSIKQTFWRKQNSKKSNTQKMFLLNVTSNSIQILQKQNTTRIDANDLHSKHNAK